MSVKTKAKGFFSEFLNSIGAILIGLLMIILCTIGLSWNELRSVRSIRAYNELEKNFIQVESKVEPQNEGLLVAARGTIPSTFTPAHDPNFEITNDSFILRRQVEVAQWKETKKNNSEGDPTYTYNLVWSSSRINSTNFPSEHKNEWPSNVPESKEFYSDDVKLGDFNLSQHHLRQLGARNNMVINFHPEGFILSQANGINYLTNSTGAGTPQESGQLRISFYNNTLNRASVLAKQQGENFTDYTTKNKKRFNEAYSDNLSGGDMISRLRTANTVITVMLRVLLCILICVGFILLFSPIQLLVKYIPFLGKWLGKATSLVAKIVGCILGVLLSVLVIAISWIMVRPLVSIPLILIVVGTIVLMVRKKKTVNTAQTETVSDQN